MTFSNNILRFFQTLDAPPVSKGNIEILWPYSSVGVQNVMMQFYTKFYNDEQQRIFLVGINPGRFGAGVTGLCFTDPIRLKESCGITHNIAGGAELSSDFVYRMIDRFGGVDAFFSRCYMTAMSPVGFIREGKNLNYYDVPGLPEQLEGWMAEKMRIQLEAGACTSVAFSMGMGKNYQYLQAFNERHGFFDRIEALPHPRWVMQYRRKRLDEFIQLYIDTIIGAELR